MLPVAILPPPSHYSLLFCAVQSPSISLFLTTESNMASDLILLSPLVDVTISKVISITNEQLNLAVGFKQELKKFNVMLRTLRGMLQDAEQKKVTGYPDVQAWLKELGNIVDEADDVVDEIAYENLQYKVAQMWEKVSYFFTLSNPLAFRLKIANGIQNLNLELADLNNMATGLGLQYRLANKLPGHIEIQQTDSSIGDPSKIVGRENKVLEVVQSLIDSSNDQPLRVVSIVGVGGIGKTTMAKLVSNNEQIQSHFFKIMWVCVSENFNLKRILVEMLQAFVENVSVDVSQDIVVQKLQENLSEKNYLLILDNVWNEDRQKWESLRSCLLGIGKNVGRRVLVTTQSESVASTMGTLSEHMHHLEKLTDEDCWSIIKQRAFVSSSCPLELERIGRDIASNCRGVALVANVIGGSLCNNRKKDDWLSIKDNSEVWGSIEEANGVLQVLQLSFNHLPTPALKQCFAFCSIFPKDFVMEKEMLVQLWMAEGFLQPFSERYMEMEDIGDKYFNALSSYSLFQDVEKDSCGSIIACKMHDLIHDLAQSISKSQTLILEDGSGRNIPTDIRHLNVISDKGTATTKLGCATKKLHTLFSQVDVFQNMLGNFKKVRVLSFYGADIDELPAFLGEMKHLRFLDVSKTSIKELPNFITKLHHLQTFRFMDCKYVQKPLKGIWNLVNLRHIYFNEEKLMPAGIGRLTCLKTLQLFVVGQQKGHQIDELGCLSQLRGKLEIFNLDIVKDREEAMRARLSEKATIQELQLVFGWESNASLEDKCKHDKDVLEGLQPHSNLKGLTIASYYGEQCPSWMLEGVNFLKNLVSITFCGCPQLKSIPSILFGAEAMVTIIYCQNLKSIADLFVRKLIIELCDELDKVELGPFAMKSLKELYVRYCVQLENLPMISELQSLEILELRDCGKLEKIGDDAVFASTCLKELNIDGCDRLMSMPRVDRCSSLQIIYICRCNGLTSLQNLHGLSSLQKIDILECGQLKSIAGSLSTATCLKELRIGSCNGLTSLPNLHGLSSLQKIDILECGQLKSIEGSLSTLTCLKELRIGSCNGLTSLPNLHGLSSLQKIDIFECGKLKSIEESLSTATCLKELRICCCSGLTSPPSLHGLSSLQKIDTLECRELKSIEIEESLSTATCLKELRICSCNGLTSLPLNLHGLSSLQKIDIFKCEALKSIGESLSMATCLKELRIHSCNGLTSFPNLHGLSSLQTLLIRDCGGLTSLPSGLSSCTALVVLRIFSCHNLISIPDDLRSIPNPACLARLRMLTIGDFSTKLQEFPDLSFIGSSLEQLTLFAWGEPRERLLDQIQRLTALRDLEIRDFDELQALPNWFGNLSSLQTLSIYNCESLKQMEAIQCLSKLQSLYIYECPELKERCARGSGSEWHNISHIPTISIDGRWIQRDGAPVEGENNKTLDSTRHKRGYNCKK